MWLNCKQKPIYTGKNGAKFQAHNLKVVGSNPTPPATNYINKINDLNHPQRLRFLVFFVFEA
tara:strand:+ start:258 stop:443 length:186 start_codon:yes stop_codon:yes gene_type:complete